MARQTVSEEMLDAFVDRQMSDEERLRLLRELADDHGLGQAVCERQQLKVLVALAYPPPQARFPVPGSACRMRALLWWRRWRGGQR